MLTLLNLRSFSTFLFIAVPGSIIVANVAVAESEFDKVNPIIQLTDTCDGRSVYVKPKSGLKPGDTVSSDEFPNGSLAKDKNAKSKAIKDLLNGKLGTIVDVSGDANPWCLNSCDTAGTACIPTGIRPYPGSGADVDWDNNPPPAKGNKKYKVTINFIPASGMLRIATECECIQTPS
jgi:hypothetical protein